MLVDISNLGQTINSTKVPWLSDASRTRVLGIFAAFSSATKRMACGSQRKQSLYITDFPDVLA